MKKKYGYQTIRNREHNYRGFFIFDRHRAHCFGFILIDDVNDQPDQFAYWGTSVPVEGGFHENVLYEKVADPLRRYYVIGNNVASLCGLHGPSEVYMEAGYSKWIVAGGGCNPSFGTSRVTPITCVDPENAKFNFLVSSSSDGGGWIVDWTRSYSPCNFARSVTVTSSISSVNGYVVTFTKRWRISRGMWTNKSYSHHSYGGRHPRPVLCTFHVCTNVAGEAIPPYVKLYCEKHYGETTIKIHSFAYYGMVN